MGKKRQYRSTLYFFPALLPLADLVPWVLTLIGAVTGIAGLSIPVLWHKFRYPIMALAALCLFGGGGAYIYYLPPKDVRMAGTRLIGPADFSIPKVLGQAAAYNPPARVQFGELWSRSVGKQILATPVISGKFLIYGSYEGSVEALALQDGTPVWSLPQAAPIFAMGVGSDGIIYACEGLHETASAALSAVQPDSGHIVWRREFLGHLEEPPGLDKSRNHLWQAAGPGGLWSVDTRNGSVLWHRAVGHMDALPLVMEGIVYGPAQPDEKKHETAFYAIDGGSGKILWQLPMPGMPWGGPVADKTGKIILTTTGEGQIGVNKPTDRGWAQGVSPDGKLLWQVDLSGMPLQPGVYVPEKDIVIYTIKTGEMVGLHVKDGSVAWKVSAGNEFQAPPVLVTAAGKSMIAATSYDGTFTIRDAGTGGELVRRLAGKSSTSSPVVQGDIVYVTGAHEIVAFGGLHALAETN
jgi:outer membrane protein assembly factor BamB